MASSLSSTAIDVEEAAAPSDERTPLMASSSLLSFPEPPPLKAIKENTWKERAVTGTAAVAVSTCIGSMLLEAQQPSVYVSSAIGCLVAPYTAVQQEKITQVEALTETNERLTNQVQELHDENTRLQTQVHDLEQSLVQYVHITLYTTKHTSVLCARVYLYSLSLSHTLFLFCINMVFIYIYIFVGIIFDTCVCVCVCVLVWKK
jgi:hypothetical protein